MFIWRFPCTLRQDRLLTDNFGNSRILFQKISKLLAHATLMLTFIYRFMPELIRQGHVYLAKPPLYKLEKNRQVWYAYSDEELVHPSYFIPFTGSKPPVMMLPFRIYHFICYNLNIKILNKLRIFLYENTAWFYFVSHQRIKSEMGP